MINFNFLTFFRLIPFSTFVPENYKEAVVKHSPKKT